MENTPTKLGSGKTQRFYEPATPGLAASRFSFTVASWHGRSWKEINNFDYIPKLSGMPLEPLAELNKLSLDFRTACSRICREQHKDLHLSSKQIDQFLRPLMEAVPREDSFSEVRRDIIDLSRFLQTRPARAQDNWLQDLSAKIIIKLTAAISASAKVGNEVDNAKIGKLAVQMKSSERTRLFSCMIKEAFLRKVESLDLAKLNKNQLSEIIAQGKQIWSSRDKSRINRVNDSRFDMLFDITDRFSEPSCAKKLLTLLRLEYEWEAWQTPGILVSNPKEDSQIAKNLDKKTLSSCLLRSVRDSLDDNTFGFPWLVEVVAYPEKRQRILDREIKNIEKRNSSFMPSQAIVRLAAYSEARGLAPTEEVYELVVKLQEKELAKKQPEAAVRGMLRIISKEEIADSIKKGGCLICQFEGPELLSFSLFSPSLETSDDLGKAALTISATKTELPKSYFSLLMQTNSASLKLMRTYSSNPPYHHLQEATDAYLHVQHPTTPIIARAVCRTYPNPNLSMSSHQREGWKILDKELSSGEFKFAVLERIVLGVDAREL